MERRPSVVTRSQSKRAKPGDSTKSRSTKHKTTKFTIQSRITLSKWKALTGPQKQEWQQRAAALAYTETPPSHNDSAPPVAIPDAKSEDRSCRTTASDSANPRSRNVRHRTTVSAKERLLPRHCCI